MPRYNYIAKSQPEKSLQGVIEAETEEEAINKLNRMGYFPVSLQEENVNLGKENVLLLRRVPQKDIVLFTRQLSNLIESGVNILNGLNILLNQVRNRYFREILNNIIRRIKDGSSLSESLGQYPQVFSGLYTAMIHSGEMGGQIEQSLRRLADFLEKEEEFKSSLRAALTYPFFIFAVSILTVVILLGFVIPRLVTMFEDMGQILPLPTKILIDLSGALRSYWWFILALIFILLFFFRRLNKATQGRLLLDRIKLKIALFGQIILKTEIGRLMRTLSLLLSSGLPIIQSLDISASVLTNEVLKEKVEGFKEKINSGENLSNCLKGSDLFPEFVVNVVSVGEEAGTLERSLLRIADEYERDVDRTLKTSMRLLEPMIILAMGLIVGFIVLSMLLPIFQINLIVR